MDVRDILMQRRLIWMLVYASVIAAEKQSVEIAVMQANEAVTRYNEAWGATPPGGAY